MSTFKPSRSLSLAILLLGFTAVGCPKDVKSPDDDPGPADSGDGDGDPASGGAEDGGGGETSTIEKPPQKL